MKFISFIGISFLILFINKITSNIYEERNDNKLQKENNRNSYKDFIGKIYKHNDGESNFFFEDIIKEDPSNVLYKNQLPGKHHRIIRPNHMITMDHKPERFNLVLDHDDRVKKTYWG